MQDQQHGIGRGALRALIRALVASASVALVQPAAAATRDFTISSFDAIRVDAPVTVLITTGVGVSARAEGDQAMLDRLRVDLSGRLLVVSLDRLRVGEKSSGAATLRLSTGMLDRIVLTGGGSVSVDRLKGLAAQVAVGGNGDVTVGDVQLDRLDVGLSGGGRVALAGRAGVATVRVTGPGAVNAEPLRARQATVGNEGAGSVALTADVAVKVVSTGSGSVSIAGKAACSVDNRGVGQVLCGGERY